MDVSFVFYKRQGSDENDKNFLVDKPIASRPNKYIDLDLTNT